MDYMTFNQFLSPLNCAYTDIFNEMCNAANKDVLI